MFRRIRWTLAAWNLLVLGLILVLVGGVVYGTLSRSLTEQMDQNLAGRAEALVATLDEEEDDDDDHQRFGVDGYSGGLFYLVIRSDGRVLSNPQRVNLAGGLQGIPLGRAPRLETVAVDDEPVRLYIRPLGRDSVPRTALVVGQSLAPEQETLRRLLMVLAGAGGAGLLLSMLGAWFLAGRALVPIQRAFQRQREFVADAAHELRTPLTVLHAATDLLHQHRTEPLEASGETFDDVRQEIVRLERLVADLLTLARSDLGELDLAVGRVDLASLAGDVVRRTEPLARSRGVALRYRCETAPLWIEGDPDRLQQVLLILLDNALQHTPAGGSVDVVVRGQGASAIMQVADNGSGIPPEQLPRVFDRFYRGDRARSRQRGSTGLGLSIARSLVDAHGGNLSLSSTVGAGTTATVRLPTLVAPDPLWSDPAGEASR